MSGADEKKIVIINVPEGEDSIRRMNDMAVFLRRKEVKFNWIVSAYPTDIFSATREQMLFYIQELIHHLGFKKEEVFVDGVTREGRMCGSVNNND